MHCAERRRYGGSMAATYMGEGFLREGRGCARTLGPQRMHISRRLLLKQAFRTGEQANKWWQVSALMSNCSKGGQGE